MAPLILTQPEEISAEKGKTAIFSVRVAAIPEPDYQWFKNDIPVKGATNATLTLKKISFRDAAAYTVSIKNDAGTVTSFKEKLNVKQL
jgi:hypothetical protein